MREYDRKCDEEILQTSLDGLMKYLSVWSLRMAGFQIPLMFVIGRLVVALVDVAACEITCFITEL
jgi:hypothetical protein